VIAAITGIDHLLVGVRDLEAAREVYSRLGFTCTPRGSHIGWGTANYCIMFERDYVELLGIVDPAQFTNRLDEFLVRREGLMALAFATSDARAAHAELVDAGIGAEPPRDLARNLELPEGVVQPRFEIVGLPATATPALPAFLCRHLTPELVRRPEWLVHANGARGLSVVTVVVAEPRALEEPYLRFLGAGATTATDDILTVRAGNVSLVFVTPADFGPLYPEVDLDTSPGLPLIAGMTVVVADPGMTAAMLADGGIAHLRGGRDSLVVPPSETCGVVIEFSRC
jgi:catechol 2,3-dioxygenase-like lactoylglutathione lyase family enzyme